MRKTQTIAPLVVLLILVPLLLAFVLPSASADQVIYADTQASGWENWSWNSTIDFASTVQVQSGSTAIAVAYDKGWAGFSLRKATPLAIGDVNAVDFWVYGGPNGTPFTFSVQSSDGGDPAGQKSLNALPNQWTHFTIPLGELGNPAQIARINWQEESGLDNRPPFYIDNIRLLAQSPQTSAGLPDATADVAIPNLDQPTGVAIAPNGRVFVAIWGSAEGNYRQGAIHSWPSTASLRSGAAPDIILGRSGNTQIGNPEALTVDTNNRLYVADTYNHRIWVYNSVTASGQQPDFVFGAQGTSNKLENKFQFTRGLAVDNKNHLFVTDEFNNRILVYNLPIASNAPTPIAQFTGLYGPRAVAAHNADLYIADSQNGQIKVYLDPVTKNNFTVPDRTLGQAHASECGSTAGSTSATYLACPIDLALDGAGNLVVSDTPNHRGLGYAAGASTPSVAYGQANFTAYLANRGGAVGMNTLNEPLGMDFDSSGALYLADFRNKRLLIFDAPTEPTATATPTATTSTPADVTLSVDAAADRHAISEYIYGIHYLEDEAFANEIDLPVRRWGGNSTTRYNWKNGMFGNPDWYFENEYQPNSADDFVAENKRTGADSIITIPMSGWVAKDPGTLGDSATYPCSYDTRKYNYAPQPRPDGRPARDPDDPKRAHCGSGITGYQNGKPVYYQGNDPADTSFKIGPAWASEWIGHFKSEFGTANSGGVRFYGLDNEPDLWHETHRDVFPTALNYDQIRTNTIDYATAIKAADPAALTLGPVLMGWTYYWHSPRDGQSEAWVTRPDRMAHGDVPLVPWYLAQMKAYETQNNVRLLDYLDLHFYPQNGVDQRDAGDANLQALRLRSTRALWDPTYVDESWIKDAGPDGGIVKLIPRMKAWVAENYPGTKLAMTEYNWGALDHINGALTQADILGIFGREGMDLAELFDTPWGSGGTFTPTGPGAYTFRLYRNYDGNGAKFGNVSVRATSSDQAKLAIYAAQRSGDGTLTIMVINKSGGALSADLSLANHAATAASVYRYSAANPNAIVKLADQPLAGNRARISFPANSMTLLVVAGGDPVDRPYRVFVPAVVRQ